MGDHPPEKTSLMTIRDYLSTLAKNWIVIAGLMVLGGVAAFAYSQTLPEQYRSESQVMIVQTQGNNTSELVQGSNYVQNLVQSYTVLARSPIVLAPVIDQLGLSETPNQLSQRVYVETPLNTSVIDISVTDGSPEGAQKTAQAITDQFAIAVEKISPEVTIGDPPRSQPAVRVENISPARFAAIPIAPNTRLNVGLGIIAGLAAGVLYALIRRWMGTPINATSDVQEQTEVPVIGEIVALSDAQGVAAALINSPHGRFAESVRQVTAGLKFVDVDHERRVIMVTSASSGEGKSSVSLGLALTLAEVGHSVLYIEADLRRPSASQYTQLEGAVGLTTVLIGEVTLNEAMQTWGNPNLHVLTSGALPPNPGQLLSSGQLRAVIDEARIDHEYVIVDTAPALSVSDALWLSPSVDGVLLVVRANRTRRERLKAVLAVLESTHTTLLGIVLNGAKADTKNPYYTADDRKSSGPRDRSGGRAHRRKEAPEAR